MKNYGNTFVELVSNNQLVSALVVAAVIAAAGWLVKLYRDIHDSKKIYEFLLKSKAGTDFTFRSTAAISSDTRIPEKRVAELCSRHAKIKRNQKEKQSWQLVG